jgi:hypothetical protein
MQLALICSHGPILSIVVISRDRGRDHGSMVVVRRESRRPHANLARDLSCERITILNAY